MTALVALGSAVLAVGWLAAIRAIPMAVAARDGPATTAFGDSGLSGTVTAPSTTVANTRLVGCMGINSSSTSTTITSPTGMEQAWNNGGKRHELADGAQAAAGSSGSRTWTFSASRAWAGWLVALRPL